MRFQPLARNISASNPDDFRLREDEETTKQKIAYEAHKCRNDLTKGRRSTGGDEADRQAVIDEPHQDDAADIGGEFPNVFQRAL